MVGRFNSNFYNRECHIIGIGIDIYKDKNWKPLNNCETDVERFISTVCKSFKTFTDSTDTVTRLTNHNATRELIRTTIIGKLNTLKSPQNLIIYFAGHGREYGKDGYLVPHDARTDYVNPEKSLLISYKDIFNWIDNKDAWHIVLILDACHAGRIMNAKRATQDKNEKTFDEYVNSNIGEESFETLMNTKSAWVITSGSDDETVLDGNENGSPFSQALNKLLEGSAKFNRPLSIAVVGSLLKRHFPSKYKQKPDFKRLSDILDYKSNKGEFVFEPFFQEKNKEKEEGKYKGKDIENGNGKYQSAQENKIKEPIPSFEPKVKPFKSMIEPTEPKVSKKAYMKKFIGLIFILLPLIFYFNTENEPPKTSTESQSPPPVYNPPLEDSSERNKTEIPPNNSLSKIDNTPKAKPNNRHKIINTLISYDENALYDKPNLVFVGSFENKSNAESILERLKKIGYEDAEIVMKENFPYAVVVTGFYQFKSSARAEVKALRKKGIEVYHLSVDMSSIYRKKD